MPAPRRQRRKIKKRPPRGCCLAGCLLWLMFSSLLGVLAGIGLFLLVTVPSLHGRLPASLAVLSALLGAPGLVTAAIYAIQFLNVRAIWRWQRWGAYALAFPLLVSLAAVLAGLKMQEMLQVAIGFAVSQFFPYGVLYLLLLPKWRDME